MNADNPLNLPRMKPELSTAPKVDISKLSRPTANLVGVNGNVFSVLGHASKALKKGGWTPPQVEAFMQEAMSGDYDNALRTCMKYLRVSEVEE